MEPKDTNIDYDGLEKQLASIHPRPKIGTGAPSIEEIRAAFTTHAQVDDGPGQGEQLDSEDVPMDEENDAPEFLDFADEWLKANPDASPDELIPMETDRVIGDRLQGGLDLSEYAKDKLSNLPPEIREIIDRATHGPRMAQVSDDPRPPRPRRWKGDPMSGPSRMSPQMADTLRKTFGPGSAPMEAYTPEQLIEEYGEHKHGSPPGRRYPTTPGKGLADYLESKLNTEYNSMHSMHLTEERKMQVLQPIIDRIRELYGIEMEFDGEWFHSNLVGRRNATIRRFGPIFAQAPEDVMAFDDDDVWDEIIRRIQESGQDTRCPQCPGDQPMVLGPLGDLLHVRCQHCGWDYALKIPPKDPLPEPEKPGLPTSLAKDNSNRFIHLAQLRNHMLPGNWREQVNRPPIDWRKLNLGKERGYCPECTDLIGSTMERIRSGDAPEGVPDDFESIVRILSRAEALCGGRDCSPRRNLQDEGNTMSDEIAEELGGDRMASSRSASCECDGDWTKDGKPCPACSCGAETCPCNCHDDCECPHCKGSRKDAKVHDDLSTRLASSGFLGSPNPELVATLSAALGSGQLARPGLVRRAQLDDPFGDDPPEPTPDEIEALRLESEMKHREMLESMSPEERRFYEETGMTFEEADRQQAAEIEGERRNEQALFGPWDLGEDEDDRRYHLASNRFARFYTSQDMKDEADRCPKCKGTGKFIGGHFTERSPGICYHCLGSGKKRDDDR